MYIPRLRAHAHGIYMVFYILARHRPISEQYSRTMATVTIIVSFGRDDSIDLLKQTLLAFLSQEAGHGEKFTAHLNVWCNATSSNRVQEVKSRLQETEPLMCATVVESQNSFLNALPQSVALVNRQRSAYVVLARCGVLPKPGCVALCIHEIGAEAMGVVTACGYRLFPHEALSSPLTEMTERVHYAYYSEAHPGRAVHVFTPDFCCLGAPILKNITEKYSENIDVSSFPHIWCSFVIGCHIGITIWKLRIDNALDLSSITPFSTSLVSTALTDGTAFEKFYRFSYASNWPMGVAAPYYSRVKMEAALTSQETCREIWKRGFAGVNMLSKPASKYDFGGAASCGVRVVRVGAVGGAQDLMYLMDTSSTSQAQDKEHLLKVIPQLRNSLIEIGCHGMKAIITVVDLPGSFFFSATDDMDMPFWESKELQLRAVKFWGLMAKCLVDLNHLIMAYDPINEPFTPQDRKTSFFEEIPTAYMDTLHRFYHDTVNEIRLHDKDTAILVKCLWYAMPIAMKTLQPLPDPNIKYSFHCYLPPSLSLNRDLEPHVKYPGTVPKYPNLKQSETVVIDRSYLYQLLLDNVVSWQKKYDVPSHQMCVAEFGVCRELPGAQIYLTDFIEIFRELGWNWLIFSFRDEEWDALDYELGPDKSNMLYRSNCDMFHSIAKHFR